MLRVALAGYGFGGRTLHAPLINATPALALDTIVSTRTEQIASEWPGVKITSFEDMLTDPAIDLAVICTPNEHHAEQAHAALDAGKHIVVDKPFAASLEDARAIADHAARAGRKLSVFHNRRWDGHIITARQVLDEGLCGRISDISLRYDRLRHVVPSIWKDQDRPGGGVWFNLGSHLADQAVHLFGKPQWLQADIFAQRPGALSDDYFNVVLGYDGFRVTLRACLTTPAPGPVIEIQGSAGAFVKYGQDTQEDMLKAGQKPDALGFGVDATPATFTAADGESVSAPVPMTCGPGHYAGYYSAMAQSIIDDGPVPVAVADTLLVIQILECGLQSAREGRRLEII